MSKTCKYLLMSIGLFLFIEVQVLVFVCVNSYINDNNKYNQNDSMQFVKTFDNKGGMKFNGPPDSDDISKDIVDSDSNKNSKNKTK